MKTCTKCEQSKPLREYNHSSRSQDGHYPRCKECRASYRQETREAISERRRARYAANREEILAKQKTYREGNREHLKEKHRAYYRENKEKWKARYDRTAKSDYNRRYHLEHRTERLRDAEAYRVGNIEKTRRACKKWRDQNRERVRNYNQNYHEEHVEERSEYYSKYRKENPEAVRHHDRLRRARKKSVNECFDIEQASFVRGFWKNRCAVCGHARLLWEKVLPIDHWLPLSKGHALSMNNAVLLCLPCNSRKSDHFPNEIFDADMILKIESMLLEQERAWNDWIQSKVEIS